MLIAISFLPMFALLQHRCVTATAMRSKHVAHVPTGTDDHVATHSPASVPTAPAQPSTSPHALATAAAPMPVPADAVQVSRVTTADANAKVPVPPSSQSGTSDKAVPPKAANVSVADADADAAEAAAAGKADMSHHFTRPRGPCHLACICLFRCSRVVLADVRLSLRLLLQSLLHAAEIGHSESFTQ